MIEVPYLTEAEIEKSAESLLDSFNRARRPILQPPVPLDDEILYFLGLGLHMDDRHARFGVPRIAGRVDILAALWIEEREIRVDESLDPVENPEVEGRYYFSIGHEIGHWQLHRPQIVATSAEPLLLLEHPSPVVCRSQDLQVGSSKQSYGMRQQREARTRMEFQANEFAACLLMPRALVQAVWQHKFGNSDPVFVEDPQSVEPELRLSLPEVGRARGVSANRVARRALERQITDIAGEFRASRRAMRIRLRKLGLILP